MGKGEIISHLGSGKYSVKLALHREHITAKISDLAAQIIVLENSITALDPSAEGYETSYRQLTVLKLSCEKKKAYLENPSHVPDDPTLDAWCADLTEDLSGEVGTIEVPGERGTVLIQPGEGGNAVYDANRDGQLQPAVGSRSAPATFYNLAMLPGWQKFKPTYRYGTISNIDMATDTCDVTLEAAISSQQDLGVNQEDTLVGISVDYMSCNASAFENGNEVLVEFVGQVWAGAKVVGFKGNPKACGFKFKLTRGDGTLITDLDDLNLSISVRDSSDDRVSISSPIYDSLTESWSFDITGESDPDGYWVSYECDDGIEAQYPFRYKAADLQAAGDLIKPGVFRDTIPYWKSVESQDPYDGYKHCEESYVVRLSVQSSVPYKVYYYWPRHYPEYLYWGHPASEYCTDPRVELYFDTGGYRAISNDGVLDESFSGLGYKDYFRIWGGVVSASAVFEVTVSWTGPGSVEFVCNPSPTEPYVPDTCPFSYFKTSLRVRAGATYDY